MEFHLKLDSKGRLCLPAEIREKLGKSVVLKESSEGLIIVQGEPVDFLEEFRRVMLREPQRTGKPENWPPSRMKSIWK